MKKITHFIIHSRAAAFVAALLMLCLWTYTIVTETDNNPIGWQNTASYLLLLIYPLTGYLLAWVDRQFALSGTRDPFPATIFFIGCCLAPQHALCPIGSIQLICIAPAIYLLLSTYRHRSAMGSYFMAFALMGIATIMTPQLLFIAPLLIIGCLFLQSLHARTLAASLLGLLFPYWIAFSILFLTDNLTHVNVFVKQLTQYTEPATIRLTADMGFIPPFSIPMTWSTIAWLVLLALPSIVYNSFNSTQQLRVRATRYFLATTTIIMFVAVSISPNLYNALIPSIILLSSAVGSALFAESQQSAGKNIWFIILLVIWLIILASYLWNSFMIY